MLSVEASAAVTYGIFTTSMAWKFSLEDLGEAFWIDGLSEAFCVALSD